MKTLLLLLLVTCHLSLVTGLAQITINLSGTIVYGGGSSSPPEFDAATRFAGASIGGITNNHTVGAGANRYATVCISIKEVSGPATVSSVTLGGVALTNVLDNLFQSDFRISTYAVVAPASGSQELKVVLSGPVTWLTVVVSTWSSANQTASLSASAFSEGSGTAVSTDIASATGKLVVDFVHFSGDPGTYTPGSGQTLRQFTESGNNHPEIGHSSEPGATTTTMSATVTSSIWGQHVLSINPP